ncbi:MAG: hypothetical protein ACREYE_28265 [Gammaproteobacteria bacterium]
MDIEHRRYIDNYLALFDTEGWRQYIKDTEDAKTDLEKQAVYSLTDERGLYRLKGRLESLTMTLALEQQIRDLDDA